MDRLSERAYNVLFLCSANSARSIMAESLLRHYGGARFCAFSAGSEPKGSVDPMAVELLDALGMPVTGLRSKGWNEFAATDAPAMNFIFTVCDQVAGETCPVWPGNPLTAHWGVPDPAAVEGSEIERRNAFRVAFAALDNRIKAFASLGLPALERLALRHELDSIGKAAPSPA